MRKLRKFLSGFIITLAFATLVSSTCVLSAAPGDPQLPASLPGMNATARTVRASAAGAAASTTAAKKLVRATLAQQPLSFAAAPKGGAARFLAQGPNFSMSLEQTGITLAAQRLKGPPTSEAVRPPAATGMGPIAGAAQFESSSAHIEFAGANPRAAIQQLDPLPSTANYFLGNDPNKWRRDVETYSRVRYAGLYPGIDLVYYGASARKFEYDLVVAPGADPAVIRLQVTSAGQAGVDADGNLRLDGPNGQISLESPMLYQDLPSGKRAIVGRFVQLAKNEFGFQHADYDHSRPLIIDPKINLVYATYSGGIHDDQAFDIVLDATGAAYVAGYTASQDFPVTSNAIQTTRMNIGTYTYDAFVMKFDASGALLFSTFLGGSQTDLADAIALDKAGDVVIGGSTGSADFPVTSNAFQKTSGGGGDAFIAKISADGSQLIYSTFLGGPGDESIGKIKANADGSFWIGGGASAAGLPASATAVQKQPNGNDNLWVAKALFASSGDLQMPYLTFIGGSHVGEENSLADIDVDPSGNVYITGGTNSADYPVSANAFEKPFPLSGGCYNLPTPNSVAILTKFSPNLSKSLYSTVVGGHTEDQNGYPVCNQFGNTVHVDPQGNMWVIGTVGTSDFPVTANALSKQLNGNGTAGVDVFVFELSPDGTKELYGSYLGGNQFDYGGTGTWDANQNVWIISNTQSTNYPVTSDGLQTSNAGGYDMGLLELSPDATKVLYGTYLGGSGDEDISGHGRMKFDQDGNIRIAGETSSRDYPVTPSAFQGAFANGDTNADSNDMYYAVLGSGAIGVVGPLSGGNAGDTTITVSGAGFEAGATCELISGGNTIEATLATVNATGTSITCNFALKGALTGSYDVVVSNPGGGGKFTKSGGFTVTGGTGPKVTTDLIGRPKVRTGSPATYTMVVTNTGDSNAYFTQVWLVVPDNFGVTFPQGLFDPYPGDPKNTVDLSPFVEGLADVDGYRYYSSLVPLVQPGASVNVQFQITVPDDEASFDLQTYNRKPWFSNISDMNSALDAANKNPASLSTTCTAGSSDATHNCLGPYIVDAATDILNTQFQGVVFDDPVKSKHSLESYIATKMGALVTISTGDLSPLSVETVSKLHPGLPVSPNKGGGGGAGESKGGTSKFGPQDILKDVWGEYWDNGGKKTVDYFLCGPIYPPNRQRIQKCGCGVTEEIIKLTYTCTNRFYGNGTLVFELHSACPEANGKKKKKKNNGGTTCSTNGGGTPAQFPFEYGKPAKLFASRLLPLDGSGETCDPEDNGDPDGGSDSCGGSGGAVDPNYKSGSAGDLSPSAYVPGSTPLLYTVGFENEPKATLPAANVVVTDQLDPAKVDLSTLTLGAISFGSNIINLPSGTSVYNTTYSLSSTLSVRIAGTLDAHSGLLKWTFTTIDPATGLPPSDPTLGFLPPDKDGIVGQGSVVFTVMPKSGLKTGTAFTNQAKVVFDTNAPINTPTWLNTLDADAPVSKVQALPATVNETAGVATFPVHWSGSDLGSGIASYTVYVSDNGGPFTVWQSAVSTTTASYTAKSNHTYGFYSVATDAAGNTEATKSAAEATTEIVGAASTTTLKASLSTATPGEAVTLTATVTVAAGSAKPTGTVTFFERAKSIGTGNLDAAGVATLAVTTLPVGSDSITATYGGDANFGPSTSTAVVVAVNKIATVTKLTTSAASSSPAASVTFTATVTPGAGGGIPTGTVTFEDGATALGTGSLNSAGVATYITSALTVGSHAITAQFGGNTTYAGSTSNTVTQVVVAPSYSVSVNPSSLTIARGSTGQATLTVTPMGGFSQAVSFACSGLPLDATCTFSPASVTPSGAPANTTLTIATDVKTASLGERGVPIGRGSSGGIDGEKGALALAFLGIGAALRSRKIRRHLERVSGPLGAARNLVVAVGMLLALATGALLGCGSSGPTTPKGTSTITVTATAGGSSQTATLSVTVQ